jgi:hypothetical protein
MRSSALPVIMLAAAVSACAASAGTPKQSKPAQACFWTRDVNNFKAADSSTVNIRVGVRDVYQLVLFSSNSDIDWTQHIGIESRGSDRICSGLDATIIVPGPIGPQRIPVTSVRKLTPEEVAALPKKARP